VFVCVCVCVCACARAGCMFGGVILHQLSNVDSLELGSVSDSVTSWTSGKSASEQFSPPPQISKNKPMIGPVGPKPVRSAATLIIHNKILLK